jgi:NTE family protein
MDAKNIRQKTLGVSFSGGGVQAWAEIAAYADLERQNVVVDAVAGTSMGSFLAAAVASGLSSEEIYEIITDTDQAIDESRLFGTQAFFSLFSLRQPLGLVLMEKLAEVIRPVNKLYGEVMLSDVPKPLAIPAVDIVSNKMIIFSNKPEYFQTVFENAEFYEGDVSLVKACLASSAYPVILSPVKIDDYQLVDGGTLMNSPAPLFSKEKIEHVLALRIPVLENDNPAEKRLEVALRAINIMVESQEEALTTIADQQYFLDVNLPGTFEFGDSGPIIRAGQVYVQDNPVDTSEMYVTIESEPEEESEEVEEPVNIIIEEPETVGEKLDKMLNLVKDFWH